MLSGIKAFFEENILIKDDAIDSDHALRLATTALLIEMIRMDDHFHQEEQMVMLAQVKAQFNLNDLETKALVDLAAEALKNSTDYYQFTSLINQHFNQTQKQQIVESLWEIAYADSQLDIDEEYLVRKISELIYVSHPDFIAAKLRVKQRLDNT